tara:strand:- start:422 stop:634 length:213 start_codon:yes stop_codon:yes gene_type:complete
MKILVKVLGGLLIGILTMGGIATLVTLPTMFLWNYVMPNLFGLQEVTFLQALALNFLASILFKTNNGSVK